MNLDTGMQHGDCSAQRTCKGLDYTMDPLLAPVIDEQVKAGIFQRPVFHSSLAHLGDALELTCAQRIENNAHVFRVTREIQEHLTVARFYVSGPYGRRVAIGTPQIDLAVFLAVDLKSGADNDIIETPDILLDGLQKHLEVKFRSNANAEVFPVKTSNEYFSHKGGELQHGAATPPYLPLRFGNARFRIFVAPALARTPEEQRQATYRLMQRIASSGGPQALVRLYPALIERPSEDVASERPEVHSFIRVCRYWAQLQNAKTLDEQATEILALIAARQALSSALNDNDHSSATPFSAQRASISSDQGGESQLRTPTARATALDFLLAFRIFLQYCASLETLPHRLTASIRPPSPLTHAYWDNFSGPVITDDFNPYRNLLDSLTRDDKARFIFCAQEALNRINNDNAASADGSSSLPTPHRRSARNTGAATSSSSYEGGGHSRLGDIFAPLFILDNTSTTYSKPPCSRKSRLSLCWSSARTGQREEKDYGRTSTLHEPRRLCSILTAFSLLILLIAGYLGSVANRHNWDWSTIQEHGVSDILRDHARLVVIVQRYLAEVYFLLSKWMGILIQYVELKWNQYSTS